MNNDNYNDIDYEEFRVKERGPVFKVIKWTVLFFVAVFALLLVARIYVNDTVPDEAKALLWNENGCAAYSEAQDFYIVEHPLDSYVNKESGEQVVRNNMTEDAYFSFSDVCYAPAVSQLQLTLRYNVSTLDHVKNDLKLEKLCEGEVFKFVLLDDKGNCYTDYAYTPHQRDFLGKRRYEYRRLLFEGVDTAKVTTLTLQVYYAEMGEAEKPLGEIIVYDKDFENAEGADRMEFDPPAGVTEGLKK